MKTWASILLIGSVSGMLFFLLNNEFTMFVLCLIMFPVIIITNYIHENGLPEIKPKDKIKNRYAMHVKTVSKKKSDVASVGILKIPFLNFLYEYFVKSYSEDIITSGQAGSPTEIGLKSVKTIFLGLIITVIFCIAAFVITEEVIAFIFLLIPGLIFFYTRFSLRNFIGARKKGVEGELLFFVVFCDIMDNTASNIYNVFEHIATDQSKLFPFMQKEALILDREINIFGKSSLEALKDLAKNHPSELFTEFIQGYLTSQSVGGKDTGDFLNQKTRELEVLSHQNMTEYTSKADSISQFSTFGLGLFPLMIVMGSSMASGNTLFMLAIFGIIFIPIVLMILIKKVESIQPFTTNDVPFRKQPIIVAAVLLVALMVLNFDYWEILGIPMLVWAFSNFFMQKKELTKNEKVENAIPRFVRDLNQSLLSTDSFYKSFQSLQVKQSYTSQFNAILNKINSQIIIGEQLSNAMHKIVVDSWLAKLIIRLLSFTAKSGEVSPKIMEKLAMFSNTYLEEKKEMQAKTSGAVMLGYMGSMLVVIIIFAIPMVSMESVTGSMSSFVDIGETGLDDTLTNVNYTLLIVTSFFSMLLVSKIRYATINHSLNAGIIVTLIMAFFYYDEFVGITV